MFLLTLSDHPLSHFRFQRMRTSTGAEVHRPRPVVSVRTWFNDNVFVFSATARQQLCVRLAVARGSPLRSFPSVLLNLSTDLIYSGVGRFPRRLASSPHATLSLARPNTQDHLNESGVVTVFLNVFKFRRLCAKELKCDSFKLSHLKHRFYIVPLKVQW